jgi:hypothetical protein
MIGEPEWPAVIGAQCLEQAIAEAEAAVKRIDPRLLDRQNGTVEIDHSAAPARRC